MGESRLCSSRAVSAVARLISGCSEHSVEGPVSAGRRAPGAGVGPGTLTGGSGVPAGVGVLLCGTGALGDTQAGAERVPGGDCPRGAAP